MKKTNNRGFSLVELILAIAILAKPFGYTGVCFADPAAWVSTGILLIITYFIWEIRMKKKLSMQEQLQQGL